MTRALITSLVLAVSLSLSACVGAQVEQDCELDNDSLRAMPPIRVTITRENGEAKNFDAKLADNNVTRAAGFQRVCASTIAAMPILFVFEREALPNFHMNNVVAPIDIAFIDSRGRIESIHAMKPYVIGAVKKPLYGPRRPVVAAFEVHKDFYAQHGFSLSSKISWVRASLSE